MLDRDALYNDLLDGFIRYQWRLENPMPHTDETWQRILHRYRTDPMFNARVSSLASGVMQIVDKHLDQSAAQETPV